MTEFLLGPLLPQVFRILLWAAFAGAFAALIFFRERARAYYRKLAFGVAGLRILYALIGTVGQYYVWSVASFTKLFLPPYQPITYLLFYTWARLWLAVALGVGLAIAFYLFLKSLERYNARFFEDGDLELGALTALLAGWPEVVIFVPAVFLAVVVLSLIRGLFFRESYTTLTAPFFLGALAVLAWGNALIAFLNLDGFKI